MSKHLREQIAALQAQIRQAEADTLVQFGREVKAARQRAKLTQDQLADRVGVGRTQITNIEAGRAAPSMFSFRAICEVLQCSADQLLGLSPTPAAQDSGDA